MNIPYKVIWLDNRTSPIYRKFIETTFNQLGWYYNQFIRKTDIMPFWYGERPQIGHLAQAAGKCRYITVQDYNVNVQDKLKKSLRNHYIPDLLIWVPARGIKPHTCVFEAKVKHWTSTDPREGRLAGVISGDLADANEQISQHGYKEGRFYCALSAIRIYCASRKWESLVNEPSAYNDKMQLFLNNIEAALDECRTGEYKPNFWWHYIAPHHLVKRVYGEEKTNPTLGVFWTGSIKQY